MALLLVCIHGTVLYLHCALIRKSIEDIYSDKAKVNEVLVHPISFLTALKKFIF